MFVTTRLATVSGVAELADFNLARYKIACWLIHEDLHQCSAYDPTLIQRYVLSLLYFTTGGPDWTPGSVPFPVTGLVRVRVPG